MCLTIYMSQFNNYPLISGTSKKYGEDPYHESHFSRKQNAKNGVKKNNTVAFTLPVSVMLIQFIRYHYEFVKLVDFCKVHLLLEYVCKFLLVSSYYLFQNGGIISFMIKFSSHYYCNIDILSSEWLRFCSFCLGYEMVPYMHFQGPMLSR